MSTSFPARKPVANLSASSARQGHNHLIADRSRHVEPLFESSLPSLLRKHTDFVNCLSRLLRQLDHPEPPEHHGNRSQHTTLKAQPPHQLLISYRIKNTTTSWVGNCLEHQGFKRTTTSSVGNCYEHQGRTQPPHRLLISHKIKNTTTSSVGNCFEHHRRAQLPRRSTNASISTRLRAQPPHRSLGTSRSTGQDHKGTTTSSVARHFSLSRSRTQSPRPFVSSPTSCKPKNVQVTT